MTAEHGQTLLIGFDQPTLQAVQLALAGSRFGSLRPINSFSDFADALAGSRVEAVIYRSPAQFLEPQEIMRLLHQFQLSARFLEVPARSFDPDLQTIATRLAAAETPLYADLNQDMAPDALRAERWASLARKIPVPVIQVDENAVITYANGAAIRLASEVGLRFHEIGQALPAGLDRLVRECLASATVDTASGIEVTVRGQTIVWSLQAVRTQHIAYLCGLNVTPLFETRRELAQKDAHHQAMLESIGDVILRLSLDGTIEYASPKWTEILGHPVEATVGTPFTAWLDPADMADAATALDQLCATGVAQPLFRVRMPDAEGTTRWISISSAIRRIPRKAADGFITLSLRDITQVQQMEDHIAQMQQLEAIGLLAGGVAHDFNNLLTGIRGYIDLAMMGTDPASQLAQDLGHAREYADQAAALTRQLLEFGKRRESSPEPVMLSTVINRMLSALRLVVRNRVNIKVELAPDLDNIIADPGHMEQFLVTLSSVAPAILPTGGELTLATSNETVEPNSRRHRLGIRPGRHVCLRAVFQGTAPAAAAPEAVVDPFASPRTQREAGVGLAMAYSVLRRFDGRMTCEGVPETGQVYRVFLPSATGGEPRRSVPRV